MSQILIDASVEELDCQIHASFDCISSADLARLFPSLPNSSEMIRFAEISGFDGFNFYHIVVRQEEKPILFLPLFETEYNLAIFLEGWAKRVVYKASHWAGRLLRPRVLAIGFVEGEWGEVGFDREADHRTLHLAWDLALGKLQGLAVQLDVDILAFSNFNEDSGSLIPINKLSGFAQIKSVPCAQLLNRFDSVEDYLSSLSKNMRKDLRRKWRKASGIKIVRTRNISPWLDLVYQFYLEHIERCDLTFGVYRKDFFEQICDEVSGAEYVLYFVGEKLAGFNLVIAKSSHLVDKYFGMDFEVGRKYNLYFVSWLENIRYCIENNIPLYHVGQMAEKTKARLGTQFLSSLILFKHRNPLIHRLMLAFREQLSYQSEIYLPEVYLGSAWDEIPVFRKEPHVKVAFSW